MSLIHRIAESFNSRKLPLRIVQPYALGPELGALSPRSGTLGAGTLIHQRIKIRSRFPRRPLIGSWVNRGAYLFWLTSRVSSSQSNVRWWKSVRASISQCSPAPSSLLNRTSVFGQVRAS
jgi:hypothetical protein